ncbi:hypothetical protein GS454_04630 [Rhodococcus hoagii]|nr:hypothetical protein [Prescottella equi]
MNMIHRFSPEMLDTISELATELGEEGFAERLLHEKERVEAQLEYAEKLTEIFRQSYPLHGMVAVLHTLRTKAGPPRLGRCSPDGYHAGTTRLDHCPTGQRRHGNLGRRTVPGLDDVFNVIARCENDRFSSTSPSA